MIQNIGLWIDHRKAVIVSINENAEMIKTITSELEKHVRFSGEAQKILKRIFKTGDLPTI